MADQRISGIALTRIRCEFCGTPLLTPGKTCFQNKHGLCLSGTARALYCLLQKNGCVVMWRRSAGGNARRVLQNRH